LTDDLGVAANFSALVVFAEHRFYGTSLPVPKANLFDSNQTLAFLTVEQAMMDFVKVI
jgi:lysosomal Pro-X carboxypeptidase